MNTLSWMLSNFSANFANEAQNKKAFWSLSSFMMIQNLLFFCSWVIFFSRISTLRGWGLEEVAFLIASVEMGCGILFTIFNGADALSYNISSGNIDTHLARPRPVLLSLLLSKASSLNLGDIFSGLLMMIFFVKPSLSQIPLIFVLALSAGLVMLSVRIITHTLVFWNVNEETSEQGFMAFLVTAFNPQKGFGAWGKFILLTIFPAGYIGLIPVEIMKNFTIEFFALQMIGSILIAAASVAFFYKGLKHYNSGNMFTAG